MTPSDRGRNANADDAVGEILEKNLAHFSIEFLSRSSRHSITREAVTRVHGFDVFIDGLGEGFGLGFVLTDQSKQPAAGEFVNQVVRLKLAIRGVVWNEVIDLAVAFAGDEVVVEDGE